jgi:hypothetical protein
MPIVALIGWVSLMDASNNDVIGKCPQMHWVRNSLVEPCKGRNELNNDLFHFPGAITICGPGC